VLSLSEDETTLTPAQHAAFISRMRTRLHQTDPKSGAALRLSTTLSLLAMLIGISCGKKPSDSAAPAAPDTAQPQAVDELHMMRFEGLEIYQISSATWNLYRDESPAAMNLCVRVECSKPIKQSEDSKYVGGLPTWELNLVEPALVDASLESGFRASIPASYDESRGGWITNFVFTSHEGSERNGIEVLAREGDRLLLRLTGEIIDVIHYSDSKPRSKVTVVTWFTRDAETKRSMQ
jgi:hypothetical protein